MELSDLVNHVGRERFEQACAWAWNTAAGTGTRSQSGESAVPRRVADVPHDLEGLIWTAGSGPWAWRVSLLFDIYREMPCYALLMYTTGFFPQWDESARQLFWGEYRTLLSDQDDRLADPVAYSLWCDYFENPDTVNETWAAVARPALLSERGLERLLDVSGPVPFRLKRTLYEDLIPDVRWHDAIFRSLLYSAYDYFGDFDPKAAKQILRQLSVPPGAPGLKELEERLEPASSPRVQRPKRWRMGRSPRKHPRHRSN